MKALTKIQRRKIYLYCLKKFLIDSQRSGFCYLIQEYSCKENDIRFIGYEYITGYFSKNEIYLFPEILKVIPKKLYNYYDDGSVWINSYHWFRRFDIIDFKRAILAFRMYLKTFGI